VHPSDFCLILPFFVMTRIWCLANYCSMIHELTDFFSA
jgi:hypothetical protein